MSLIPGRYRCSTCDGYVGDEFKRLNSRCKCNETRGSVSPEARERAATGTPSPVPSRAVCEKIAASCEGKTPYLGKADALRVIRHRAKPGRIDRAKGRGTLDAYKCRNCRSWHIGSAV